MDRFVEQPLAPTLGGLAIPRVLFDVGDHARIEDQLPIVRGIKATIEVQIDLLYPPLLPLFASRNLLLYQSLPTSTPCRHAMARRRKDDTCVGTAARRIVE